MSVRGTELSRAIWRKSTYSNNGGNCVEVATNLPGLVAIRDSKKPEGAVLVVGRDEWQEFVRGLKLGGSAANR